MIAQPTTTEVNTAIDEIISHEVFHKSPLMCAFLRYVAAETLAGRESRISAYSVAIDALKKSPTFDPQADPSVRVLAKRLRDSLDTYYSRANGIGVMVVMRPGSYVPQFEKVAYYPRVFLITRPILVFLPTIFYEVSAIKPCIHFKEYAPQGSQAFIRVLNTNQVD